MSLHSLNVSCIHYGPHKQVNTPKCILCHSYFYYKRDISYFTRVLEFRHRTHIFLFIIVVRSILVTSFYYLQFNCAKSKDQPLVIKEMKIIAQGFHLPFFSKWWLIVSTWEDRIIEETRLWTEPSNSFCVVLTEVGTPTLTVFTTPFCGFWS